MTRSSPYAPLVAASLFAVAACSSATPRPGDAIKGAASLRRTQVGRAAFLADYPVGETPPSNFFGAPVTPKVVADFAGVPSSNDWWSSLIWQFDGQGVRNAHSMPMFPHPLAVQARADGLAVGYPNRPVVSARSYFFPFAADLVMGVAGLDAAATRVVRHSDFTVTARWQDDRGARRLDATFGHGLPFVYADVRGGSARITPQGRFEIWRHDGEALGITINAHHYGVFAPKGATWLVDRQEGGQLSSNLGGAAFFSLAILPDRSAFDLFRRHAYAFVEDTRIEWQYTPAQATVQSRYRFVTKVRQPSGIKDAAHTPLVAAYPHQWRAAALDWQPQGYVSPRGQMKLAAVDHFVTTHPFHGVVPVPPAPGKATSFSRRRLAAYLEAAADAELFPAGPEQTRGTYWVGKSLQKVANLVFIADQLGERDIRDRLVAALERELEDWFDGRPPNAFIYDRTWRTLIGTPSEYRTGWELNDHHFHYGYFIFAAATVATFDPAWADRQAFGAMVDLLVKDCANSDRRDGRFAFMRNFDPYAGHSWANGPALFADGNNEESSSEDVNFATALVLWGTATGRDDLRDLGIYLHTQIVAAVENYWFDVHGDVFPKGFDKPVVAMVWGSGGKYDTWFDRNPVYVHGINMLPFTGGSFYLGHHPQFVRRNHAYLLAANHGQVFLWRDVILMYLALADADTALQLYEQDDDFDPEFGNSRAALYHWLGALAHVGGVDTQITADAATAVVFRKGERRTYVGWNPGHETKTFTFSDQVRLVVPPRRMADATRPIPTSSR